MPKAVTVHHTWLRSASLRVTRARFAFLLAVGISIGVFNAAHLMPPPLIEQRVITTAVAVFLNVFLWYFSHRHTTNPNYYRILLMIQIVADIVFASFMIYSDRGAASRSVIFYAIPILVAGTLVSKSALYGTAALCTAAYCLVGMHYFYVHTNEMLHAELYGVLVLYSAMFFVMAAMLWAVVRARK
jgi:hypothetical protein